MKLLVVSSGFSRRPTLLQNLLAFENYSDAEVKYFNTRVPHFLQDISNKDVFDLVIFSTLFFSRRTNKRDLIADFLAVAWLKELNAVKVALPQDEYINSKLVNDFIDEFKIKLVFSVQPESVVDQVYPSAQQRGFEVKHILTGYIDDKLFDKFSSDEKWIIRERKIDIGYRTTGIPPAWYGKHARLKSQIADEFLSACKDIKLVLDIKPSQSSTISNELWYEFLGNCKYTIGTEGGTSILDFDGAIKQATDDYVFRNPDATFEEIEQNCFPDKDGQFKGFALSPRHLEACLTRTAQILTRGDYSGVLKPWEHYIPVEKDFSNLNEVIELVKDDRLRVDLVNRCFSDIVESDKYKLSSLVEQILSTSMQFVTLQDRTPTKASLLNKSLSKINKPGGIIYWFVDIYRWFKKFIV